MALASLPALLLVLPAARASEEESSPAPATAVDFARDVRPILSDRCFACHGPDSETREAGLRLDLEEEAFADLGGYAAIVGGDLAASELWHRVAAEDDFDRMPPPDFGPGLSADDLDTLKRWIEEGAAWQQHWSFVPPEAAPLPDVDRDGWARDEIDHDVLARMESEGLTPAPEAAPETLLRRATFDLTGVPPTLGEIDAYLAEDPEVAFERAVDRLLASPRYGERMALPWLDAARYADTNGYHRDASRTMWLWRDWLIDALNQNQPYDEMVVDMLAGDLLPEPRTDQLIATGFNRNHMLNDEGGAIPEEYQVVYVVDRVRTTATTFLGLTMACGQCHDHKYDPISQEDYFRFYAFFNRLPEKGLDGSNGPAEPALFVPREEDQAKIRELRSEAEALRASLDELDADDQAMLATWLLEDRAELARWTPLVPERASAIDAPKVTFDVADDGRVQVGGANPAEPDYELVFETDLESITALWLEVLTYGDDGYHKTGSTGRTTHGNWVISEFEVAARPRGSDDAFAPIELRASADYSQDTYAIANAVDGDLKTGWAVDGHELIEPRNAVFAPLEPFGFAGGTEVVVRVRQRYGSQHAIGNFRVSASSAPEHGLGGSDTTLAPWSLLGPVEGKPDRLFAAGPKGSPEWGVDLDATQAGLTWEKREDFTDGAVHALEGENSAFYLHRYVTVPSPRTLTLSLGSDDSLVVWVDGRRVLANNAKRGAQADQDKVDVPLAAGRHELLIKVVNYGGPGGFYFDVASEGPHVRPGPITQALRDAGAEDSERELLRWYRANSDPEWSRVLARAGELDVIADGMEADAPGMMVMRDEPGVRMTRMLMRGQYDQPGRAVTAGVPAFLPPLQVREDSPTGEADRLDLARWMVQPDHPLTARVQVNRIWQTLFGKGLVTSPEDFGAQGEFPTNPELLDRLAVDYVASGWDTKALVRRILLSATYRQSSAVSPAAAERDPGNRWMSRAPSFRLPAEHVRDNALFVSGLLRESVGGPSVRPYQPEGLWKDVSFRKESRKDSDFYTQDSGDALYRRGIYTFWKRALPPPSLQIFDAPTREICTVSRGQTNTPMQALVLMNDPTYVEAARHLAQRTLLEAGRNDEDRVERAFRRTVSRFPSTSERAVLLAYLESERARFAADPDAASALLAVGESMPDASFAPEELAAWTSLGSVLLNLDETVTRR